MGGLGQCSSGLELCTHTHTHIHTYILLFVRCIFSFLAIVNLYATNSVLLKRRRQRKP